MISTLYTIENQAGVSFSFNDHSTDPTNFIALQQYPQFDLDIKNNEIAREGQHGIWDFFSFYGKRTINFQGLIIGDSELSIETQKNLMLNVLGFPTQPTASNAGLVYLRWTDVQGNAWEIECKLSSNIQFNRPLRQNQVLEFNLNLKSADPFIYSQTEYSIAGTRGYTVAGGMFPLPLPALLGETYPGALSITSLSQIDSQTIIRIYGETAGAITNPRVRNLTTGKSFNLSTTLANENSWIEIDSKLGTVVNEAGVDKSGDIIGDSEFTILVPGVNEILYESDQDPVIVLYFPTAPFTVKYRDTKI